MRTDQLYGLNAWAREIVHATQVVSEIGVRKYPNETIEAFVREVTVPIAAVTKISEIECAFAPGTAIADLNRYELPDGRVFEEYIQSQPWSGGPCYYIALKDETGQPVSQSLWTKKQMA
jgi:hypothetical protein